MNNWTWSKESRTFQVIRLRNFNTYLPMIYVYFVGYNWARATLLSASNGKSRYRDRSTIMAALINAVMTTRSNCARQAMGIYLATPSATLFRQP